MATNYHTNIMDFTGALHGITSPIPGSSITGTVNYQGSNVDPFSSNTGMWYKTNQGTWTPFSSISNDWNIDISTSGNINGPFIVSIKRTINYLKI